MIREYERVTCPGCGRNISAYVPHMGDGSALRTTKHLANHPEGLRRGSHATRECSMSQRLIQFNSHLGGWEISL